MRHPENGFKDGRKRMTRSALQGFVIRSQLHLGEFKVPVAEFVPHEAVDGVGGIVETVFGKGLMHRFERAREFALNPAIHEREGHGLAGVASRAAVLAFDVHQREARGVPKLVAEVAVAFAALDVEVDVAAQRGVCRHRKSQGIRTVGIDAVGVALAEHLLYLRRFFRLAQTAGIFLDEVFKIDAADEVEGIQSVPFALAHLLAFRIAHETVDVHVLKRHAAREVLRHHHHAGDPEEDDVVARDEHGGGEIQVVSRLVFGLDVGASQRREGHERGAEPRIENVFVTRERNV